MAVVRLEARLGAGDVRGEPLAVRRTGRTGPARPARPAPGPGSTRGRSPTARRSAIVVEPAVEARLDAGADRRRAMNSASAPVSTSRSAGPRSDRHASTSCSGVDVQDGRRRSSSCFARCDASPASTAAHRLDVLLAHPGREVEAFRVERRDRGERRRRGDRSGRSAARASACGPPPETPHVQSRSISSASQIAATSAAHRRRRGPAAASSRRSPAGRRTAAGSRAPRRRGDAARRAGSTRACRGGRAPARRRGRRLPHRQRAPVRRLDRPQRLHRRGVYERFPAARGSARRSRIESCRAGCSGRCWLWRSRWARSSRRACSSSARSRSRRCGGRVVARPGAGWVVQLLVFGVGVDRVARSCSGRSRARTCDSRRELRTGTARARRARRRSCSSASTATAAACKIGGEEWSARSFDERPGDRAGRRGSRSSKIEGATALVYE